MNLRRNLVLLLLCFAAVAPMAHAASPNVVISQVYGGGGSGSGSPAYTHDYVELFNRSNAPVVIAGWSIQYGSSTGQFASSASNLFAFPAGTTIGAGKYLTVKLGAAGSLGATFSSDFTTGGLSMAAGSGKVALANVSASLGCGATATPCALPDARIVDVVSYGASNNGEGSTTVNSGTGLQSSQGAIRKLSGCQDTDNNVSDFTVNTVATGLVPRTASAPANVCGSSNAAPSINAPANPAATVNQDAAPFTVSLSGSDDNSVFVWSATAGSGVANVVVSAGQGSGNVTYSVTLAAGFSGTASFTASLSDNVNAATTRTVNIAVTPSIPNAAPSIHAFANPVATVAQDAAAFNVSFSGVDDNNIYQWSATTGTGVSAVAVVAGQGSANVTYSVTLQPGFSGTASFTAVLSDSVNPNTSANATVTVTAAPPPPLDHVVISQVYGGGGNDNAAWTHDFVELYNPDTVAHDLSGWTIQYGSTGGTTWQVHPLGGTIQPGEYYLIRLGTNGNVGTAVPAANINGSLNLSGTNGKIALVAGGDPLDACAINDPLLVDLVGYGTANCREGATNAPAPSLVNAIFRKNGGFTDTNVNGADFVAAPANPRRTAPIVELPPTTLSSDPRRNGSNAPRDASITVTFTEAVDVTDGWFSINCTTTGLHDSATVASGGVNAWIIIPNVNFLAGEQCTLTVHKAFVHDSDLDDALPNTDQLTKDYTATFTVATGAAPSYAADVHTTFGNPSGATADVNNPNNYLMVKPELTLSYNRDRGIPNWVSWHLADEWIGSLQRVDTFRADPAVPADWYRVTHVDYSASGFDRGHMVPNADRDPETSMPINQATFLMTNMIPQAPDNNQGPWANMENFLRTLLPSNELYIVSGGAGDGGIGSNGGVSYTINNGKIAVPAQTWKVVLVLPKDSGDDVSRVTAATRTIAVIMPNVQGIRNDNWMNYLTTIDAVEALTGYDFFANTEDAVENAIEAGVNGVNPPGVTSQSLAVTEDVAKTFDLNAVSATQPLTYTIVSGPAHGTLSGSGASQTYTPAADYFGSDSFTFKVSNGTRSSNTATMTIDVREVNDAPIAADDARSTSEDTPLTFNAADLTANDTGGPANEADQTLTVTSVTGATLTNGVITFTPAADFHGSASFTYEVCDNGITSGASDSRCATATVTVSISSVNDEPVASLTAPSTGVEGSAIAASITANDIDGDALTLTWSVTRNGAPFANGSGASVAFTPDDNGSYVITATAADASASGSATATVEVSNLAPSIASVAGPTATLSLGTPATIVVTYSDAGAADTHTATFTWNDGTTTTAHCANGTCTAARTYGATGIYTVGVVVSDDDGAVASTSFSPVVVYNANGGSLTTGGWLSTPAGKATVTINARYAKNATTPTGNARIELAGATLVASSFDYLVVNGTTATLQGNGTIGGNGNYAFSVTAVDAATDSVAVRVWDKTTNSVVFESTTAPFTGSVQIHK
ncbi:MAG TPA: DNA/RNA non-specific endonuclease [Thermoanaerobaculia bacterium]|jgi:endonuclease G